MHPEPQRGPWEPGPKLDAKSSLPSVALSLLTFALIGVSLTLFATTLALTEHERSELLIRNVLGAEPRKALLMTVFGGAFVPLVIAFAFSLRRGDRARFIDELSKAATLLAPLCLLFVLPLLFLWRFAQDKPAYYLVLLSAFVIASRTLLTRSLEVAQHLRPPALLGKLRAIRLSHWTGFALVVLGAAGYAAFTGHYSVLRHRLIQTAAFDLGIYDNLLYNALHGSFFRSPVLFGPGDYNYIAGHAEYAMLLFVPIYALHPNAETLLWLQAVMIGGAAIPLYMFARQFIAPLAAVVVSLAYLLFAPLHGPNFYDFHWLPLAIFFHFWLYYALATRKNWLAIPMILVLYAIREDVALGLVLLGVFLFVTGARVRFGIALTLLSALWFVANKFVIMPLAGSWWFENIYVELFADGNKSYGSVILTLLSNPSFALTTLLREVKLVYLLHMLAPLVFLPARKPAFLLLLIPGAFFTLLTTSYAPTVSIAFQYTTHFIPYLFLALVLSLWRFRDEPLGKPRMNAALITLAIAVLSHSHNFGALLQQESVTGGFGKIYFDPMTAAQKKRYQAVQKIIKLIPQHASVAAGEYMNPYISARKDAYVFRYEVGNVDYIFFSKLELSSKLRRTLNDKFKSARYGLLATTGDEFYLWKRGHESKETTPTLKKLGLAPRNKK